MKKKKPQPEERKEIQEKQENKPWLLNDISPQVRKMAKESAGKYNAKVSEWVTHAIIKTHKIEQGQIVHLETFSELMEEYPNKEFMKNWFLGLRGKIEDLSEKIDEVYGVKPSKKPWWKFWH